MKLISLLTAACLLLTVLLLAPIHCYIEYSFYPIKEVFLLDEHVLFRLNLTNKYTTGLLFLTWGTPLDYIPGPILWLTEGGNAVTFICPVASRLPPSAEDFEFLPAGDGISVLYNVSSCYSVDTAGNYSANTSTLIAAKLMHSVSADTSYNLDTFSLLDLSVSDISFCVLRSVSGVCLLASDRSGDKLFNRTLISFSNRLLPPYLLVAIMWTIYCIVITILF